MKGWNNVAACAADIWPRDRYRFDRPSRALEAAMPERQVRFYELLDRDGAQFPDLNVETVLDAVDAIPDSDAYVQIARMELLGTTYRPPSGSGRAPMCPMIVLDRITREVRMRIENNRRYRPLELGENDTIAEPTHYGLFPRNVIGILRASGNAPGPASIRDFLNTAELLDEEVTIKPLVDLNALRALGNMERITRLDVELDSGTTAEVLGRDSMLAELLGIYRRRLGGVTVEIGVKIDPKGTGEASEVVHDELERLVRGEGIRYVDRAKVKYRRMEDGRADSFDFLNEAVAHSVEVDIDDATNGPNDRSASEGIAHAYDLLHDDIQSALRGSHGETVPTDG